MNVLIFWIFKIFKSVIFYWWLNPYWLCVFIVCFYCKFYCFLLLYDLIFYTIFTYLMRIDSIAIKKKFILYSATSLTSHLTWKGDHWRVIARGSWHIKLVQVLNPRNRCAKSSADDVHITLFHLLFLPSFLILSVQLLYFTRST